jgi:hypothetical protein
MQPTLDSVGCHDGMLLNRIAYEVHLRMQTTIQECHWFNVLDSS